MNKRNLLISIFILCSSALWAQQSVRNPQIGYVYPAGGQAGTSFEVIVGGQYLNGVGGIHVSGEGVRATTVTLVGREQRLSEEQRLMVQIKMMEVNTRQWKDLFDGGFVLKESPPWAGRLEKTREQLTNRLAKTEETFKWPNHHYLRDLDSKNMWELGHIRSMMAFDRNKIQPNAQIAETAIIKMEIAPDAMPGYRELRLQVRQGLTNAMVFHVDSLPEFKELEPNDPGADLAMIPPPPPLVPPMIINGQIMPGDVDLFKFSAAKGQRLVIDVNARRLVPFLADAVPGWFQAVVTIYDEEGKEIAYTDDFHFDPDPVMLFEVPADGIYTLEIRDSIYRGREDFVYRVAVSERPFVTHIFPLGFQEGQPASVQVHGWNLSTRTANLSVESHLSRIQKTSLMDGGVRTNTFLYAVDALPERLEAESNDTLATAETIELGTIINGRIEKDGDKDVYRFAAKQGDRIVAEVNARRLRSPLDSLVQILDTSGKVLAWNDDLVDKVGDLHRDMGLQTHHADSYLMVEIPRDGNYFARISDTRGHGGEDFGYRLRLSHPHPDFQLIASPSCINQQAGNMLLDVYALRRDGYDGPIEIALGEGITGYELHGAVIPAGSNHVRMTLGKKASKEAGIENLRLTGKAFAGGVPVHRAVVPADDTMQAFLWRHLAPSSELLVQSRRWGNMPLTVTAELPLQIHPGQTLEVPVKFVRNPGVQDMDFELYDAPAGISLKEVQRTDNGATMILAADSEKAKVGLVQNLIVEAFRLSEVGKPDKDGKRELRRQPMGYLPAVAIEIVQ